jgi:hypothetical protein
MQNALNVEQARLRGLVVRRRDGLFSNWHLSEMCTGAREKNGNMPLWHVAYSHFRQGREPRRCGVFS